MLGIAGGQGFSKLGNPGSGKKIQKFQGYISETVWNSMPPSLQNCAASKGAPQQPNGNPGDTSQNIRFPRGYQRTCVEIQG